MGTKTASASTGAADLQRLAQLYGVETNFIDMAGKPQQASPDSLMTVLSVLGAPIASLDDAKAARRERLQANWRERLEPVHVVWDGGPGAIKLRLPLRQSTGAFECVLRLEEGGERRWSGQLEDLPDAETLTVERVKYVVKRLAIPEHLPLGYHRLTLEAAKQTSETLVIAAPTRAFSPQGKGWERSWGVFLPLYALHSERSWGAGDFSDLRGLRQWTQELGGSLVGTLPLLAAFLDEPFEISPYSPVSRLFWNEFYLNIEEIPELSGAPAARAILETPEFQEQLKSLREAPMVDYRRLGAMKRQVVAELARFFFAGPSERRTAFEQYVTRNPYLNDYAAFRAVNDRLRMPWRQWPEQLRNGTIGQGDYNPEDWQYHLYAQWLADQQLEKVADRGAGADQGLYLDLPLGVNSDGYDVWREREAFAVGAAGGCPPDPGFPKGQNWGFVPLHPQGIRNQGYRYVRAFLQHQLRYAAVLRIDHMPNFHRVYWIPPGLEAKDGVFVRYPAEELYAVFCMESQRHRTLIVGEDLGTVPPEVPPSMARHNFHRMYVVQYEMKPDPGLPIPEAPAASVASVNTHDMPPFAAYWQGQDIGERLELGLLSQEQSWEEEKTRQAFRTALTRFLQAQGRLDSNADAKAIYQACLETMKDGPARMLLVNLEDLWQETQSQNVPSTYEENPNWRRKARHSFEEIKQLSQVTEVLEGLTEAMKTRSNC